MPNLTKKDIKQLLSAQTRELKNYSDQQTEKLARIVNKSLTPLADTLSRTTAVVADLVEIVRDLKTDMKTVTETLNSHTIALDAILKNTETQKAENAAFKTAIERHERWFAQIADKVGVKLEGLEKQP